jgi:two-component system LytT family response regulator
MRFNLYFFKVNIIDFEIVKKVIEDNKLFFSVHSVLKDIEEFKNIVELNMADLVIVDKDVIKSDELNYVIREFENKKIVFVDSFINKTGFVGADFSFVRKYYEENILIELILIYGELIKKAKIGFEKEIKKPIFEINPFASSNKPFIAVSSVDRIDIIPIKEIIYFTADGKYTVFYLQGNKEIISSKNIGEYEGYLPCGMFFRIHHKYIVNMDFVLSINKKDGYYCKMINGKNLPIAKRRQDEFNKFVRLKY